MNSQCPLNDFDVSRMPLTFGDYLVLLQEQICGLLKRLADLEHARATFAHEFQIPILGEIFRMGKAVLFRRDTPVLSSQIGRVTCFMFFGQLILLFWTAGGELSDVEERFREAR